MRGRAGQRSPSEALTPALSQGERESAQGHRPRPLRLLAFAVETHPPLVYTLVSAGWVYSLLALMGAPALPAGEAPLMAVVFFLVLLYLRAIDEIKDLPYDRQHHPDRPLVRGAVTVPEVAGFAAFVAGIVIGLAAWLSPLLALGVAGQLGYGLVLLVLERRWQRFKDDIVLNLVITFPVSAVLNLWVMQLLLERGLPTGPVLPVVLVHVSIFLHLEVGRKLAWPAHLQAGEASYTRALGVGGAVLACALLGVAACALATQTLYLAAGGWALLPWLAMGLSAVGLWRFVTDRDRAAPRALKPWFGGAMVLFFVLNAAVGFAA